MLDDTAPDDPSIIERTMTDLQTVSTDDVEALYGLADAALPADAVRAGAYALEGLDWRRLAESERDAALRLALETLDDQRLAAAGPDGLTRWETGWGEVLERVRQQGATRESLRPQYFKYDTVRFQGDYARVSDPAFEFRLYRILLDLTVREFFQDVDVIIDVCCGTGLNLLEIGQKLPGRTLIGYDWARPSQEILALIAREHGLDLTGHRLDLWTLDGFDRRQIPRGRIGVLTTHGLEQLGGTISPVLDLIAMIAPDKVVHIEPILENYDPAQLFDALAIRYHRKRRYLEGLQPAILRRVACGQARLLRRKRFGLGSMFHEGYSLLAWAPTSSSV